MRNAARGWQRAVSHTGLEVLGRKGIATAAGGARAGGPGSVLRCVALPQCWGFAVLQWDHRMMPKLSEEAPDG